MATSFFIEVVVITGYNWLFLWDYTVHKWGYKWLITGISGHNCKVLPAMFDTGGCTWLSRATGPPAGKQLEEVKSISRSTLLATRYRITWNNGKWWYIYIYTHIISIGYLILPQKKEQWIITFSVGNSLSLSVLCFLRPRNFVDLWLCLWTQIKIQICLGLQVNLDTALSFHMGIWWFGQTTVPDHKSSYCHH